MRIFKSNWVHYFITVIACCIIWLHCSDKPGPVEVTNVENDGKTETFIIDRTGKGWEVSHARDRYGLKPEEFQFGLGPNAILPIKQPIHLSPGESGYPSDNSTFLIMATVLNDEARAYGIDKMSFHEAATEEFGDIHVTVAY